MLDPELVSQVLAEALSSGGRFAELFAEIRSSTSIRLDDGKIEEVVSGRDRGAGVRVFHGDAQAYAFSNRLEPNALLEAARVAAGAVRESGRGVRVVDLRRGEPYRHVVEEPVHTVSVDRKVGWLREADDAARSLDPSVRQVMGSYADSRQQVLVATSEGLWAEEERPRVRLVIQVVASRDGVMQTGHEGPGGLTGAELLRRFPPAQTGERAARQAVAMLDGNPSPAGEMAVVLGPGGGGILFHEACGHGLEADHVQKDASIFKGKLGQRLASSLVIGVDDGTIPSAWGSFAVDDEGTPAHRTVLFEGGELIGYLYDRFCADRDGVQSTGNGRRQSYAHLPIPRMSNSSILSGSDRADDIIASTSRGVYAKTLGGGQVNPATGDFVFGVSEGYLIEDGRITSPVRGANLIGNGPQILAAIDGVADDFETRDGVCGKEGQGAPVSNGSPTVRIARMTVGGTVA
ncbi:MAG TPA: TldD/PmbA family protein [Actinomycetota bacterium]|nr:TldD/PmbA family protein [Actinomycetota bacterium]